MSNKALAVIRVWKYLTFQIPTFASRDNIAKILQEKSMAIMPYINVSGLQENRVC